MPMLFMSGEKGAFGAVSGGELVVRQLCSTPEEEVVHPAGKAGTVTASKFWVEIVVYAPRGKTRLVEPRLEAPSCNRRIGLIEPPQVPEAEKVNGWLMMAPPTGRTP